MMALTHFVVLSVVVAAAVAELLIFNECGNVPQGHCSVTEVRIDPCTLNNKRTISTLERGDNVTLSFDFTPQFSTSNLKTMVFYEKQAFGGMTSDDACQYTSCPSESGNSQTLTYHLYIGHKLPKGTYAINWKVWNGDNKDQVCCFTISIKLKKTK